MNFYTKVLSRFASSPNLRLEVSFEVPVDRDQFTFGLNYYFSPSLVVKAAYEINHERHGVNLHDSVFLAQIAWGF